MKLRFLVRHDFGKAALPCKPRQTKVYRQTIIDMILTQGYGRYYLFRCLFISRPLPHAYECFLPGAGCPTCAIS